MAKGPGKKFEEDFIKSIPDRCDVTRLKDAGGWSRGGSNMRFTSSNPCDFIVWSLSSKRMYKLELKSTLGKALPFGNIKTKPEAMYKFIEDLVKSEDKGVYALFVVNFRETGETFRVLASAVQEFVENTDRKSIPLSWFRGNGIIINQSLARIRWRYDLEWL